MLPINQARPSLSIWLTDTCEQSNDAEDESLSMRLMLLCSIDTTLDLTPYFEGDNLASLINAVGAFCPILAQEAVSKSRLTLPSF